jgi:hypothetical protein
LQALHFLACFSRWQEEQISLQAGHVLKTADKQPEWVQRLQSIMASTPTPLFWMQAEKTIVAQTPWAVLQNDCEEAIGAYLEPNMR